MTAIDIGRLIIEILALTGTVLTGLIWLGKKIEGIRKAIVEFRPIAEARFEGIEKRLDSIDGRLNTMNGNVAAVIERTAKSEGAIETLQERPR